MRAHQGDIALHGGHEDMSPAGHFDDLLAVLGDRAHACGCEKAAQSRAARPEHLGERPLRRELDAQAAAVHGHADLRVVPT
jgi:hypothetical protein